MGQLPPAQACLPVLTRTQICNVRSVMAGVPRVNSEHGFEILPAGFRMVVAALEVRVGERLEQRYPALVQSRNHGERAIDGKAAVGETGPCCLVVGLDDGPVFG